MSEIPRRSRPTAAMRMGATIWRGAVSRQAEIDRPTVSKPGTASVDAHPYESADEIGAEGDDQIQVTTVSPDFTSGRTSSMEQGRAVDVYVAADCDVVVPRPDCPRCSLAMTFWSGYHRQIRAAGQCSSTWVLRVRCDRCRSTHALVPAFMLVNRLDAAETIAAYRRHRPDGTRPGPGATYEHLFV
jgi:hypothetical protein